MNVSEYIQGRQEFGGKRPNSHGRILIRCPFHSDRKPSFSLNVETGGFICRSASCGVKGGFLMLYKLLENIQGWGEVYARTQGFDGIRRGLGRNGPVAADVDDPFALETGRTKREAPSGEAFPHAAFAHRDPWAIGPVAAYLRTREVSQETAAVFGICGGVAGKVRYRAVLPYYDLDGAYQTWVARSVVGAEPRYLAAEGGLDKRCVYGLHTFTRGPVPVVLAVEGPFDVLRLYERGIIAGGFSGVEISAEQILAFVRGVRTMDPQPKVVVMLDPGADRQSDMLCSELVLAGLDVETKDVQVFGCPDAGELPNTVNIQDFIF